MSVHLWVSSLISGDMLSVYCKMLHADGPKCSNLKGFFTYCLDLWHQQYLAPLSIIFCCIFLLFEICSSAKGLWICQNGEMLKHFCVTHRMTLWMRLKAVKAVLTKWSFLWRLRILGFKCLNFWIQKCKIHFKNTDYLKYVFNKSHTERWQILK